jgi:hypothetical protein
MPSGRANWQHPPHGRGSRSGGDLPIAQINEWAGNRTELELVQEMVVNILKQPREEVNDYSLTQCRKLLKGHYIHIADYVMGNYTVTQNKPQLLKRCRKIGFFPLKKAKSDGFRALLRRLL